MNEAGERQEALVPDFVQAFYLEKEHFGLEKEIISYKKELEGLQDKLAQTEDILEKAEEMKRELLGEIDTLVEQRSNLQKQCDECGQKAADLNLNFKKLCGKQKAELAKAEKQLWDRQAELEEADRRLQLIKLQCDRKYVSKKRESALLITLGVTLLAALGVTLAVIFCSWINLNGRISELSGLEMSKGEILSKSSDIGEYAGSATAENADFFDAESMVSGEWDMTFKSMTIKEEERKELWMIRKARSI